MERKGKVGRETKSEKKRQEDVERKKEEIEQRKVKEQILLRLIVAVNACHVEGRVGAVATG